MRLLLIGALTLTFGGCAERSETLDASVPRSGVARMVAQEAQRQQVPVRLALAVARTESNFNPNARSRSGAVGVMQILPSTARTLGHRGSTRDLFHAGTNIRLGVAYLKQGYVEGGERWAALRYHGGPNARAHGRITKRYAATVLSRAAVEKEITIAAGTTD